MARIAQEERDAFARTQEEMWERQIHFEQERQRMEKDLLQKSLMLQQDMNQGMRAMMSQMIGIMSRVSAPQQPCYSQLPVQLHQTLSQASTMDHSFSSLNPSAFHSHVRPATPRPPSTPTTPSVHQSLYGEGTAFGASSPFSSSMPRPTSPSYEGSFYNGRSEYHVSPPTVSSMMHSVGCTDQQRPPIPSATVSTPSSSAYSPSSSYSYTNL